MTSWQSRTLAALRMAQQPSAVTAQQGDRLPPMLTFVTAGLAGFRGIATEILWFRVTRLQDEGRYLELVQLTDWITLLDPYTQEGWIYNAWNLAYNISVMYNRPEDRLRWVRNGISLLRDEALRFNPRDAKLYRELSWLYSNKIGDSLDSAHETYKLALAEEMAPFLFPNGTVNVTPENSEGLAALRLDVKYMADLENRFGPLDWRMPDSHALYWADSGIEFANEAERLLCERAIYSALIRGTYYGRFAGNLDAGQWRSLPNIELEQKTVEYLKQIKRLSPPDLIQRFQDGVQALKAL